jgi:hypothetical protein
LSLREEEEENEAFDARAWRFLNVGRMDAVGESDGDGQDERVKKVLY